MRPTGAQTLRTATSFKATKLELKLVFKVEGKSQMALLHDILVGDVWIPRHRSPFSRQCGCARLETGTSIFGCVSVCNICPSSSTLLPFGSRRKPPVTQTRILKNYMIPVVVMQFSSWGQLMNCLKSGSTIILCALDIYNNLYSTLENIQ